MRNRFGWVFLAQVIRKSGGLLKPDFFSQDGQLVLRGLNGQAHCPILSKMTIEYNGAPFNSLFLCEFDAQYVLTRRLD
ncbi:MAG: hypothetical protein ACI85V_002442 [bacterium]|jgi:hypothetical protein